MIVSTDASTMQVLTRYFIIVAICVPLFKVSVLSNESNSSLLITKFANFYKQPHLSVRSGIWRSKRKYTDVSERLNVLTNQLETLGDQLNTQEDPIEIQKLLELLEKIQNEVETYLREGLSKEVISHVKERVETLKQDMIKKMFHPVEEHLNGLMVELAELLRQGGSDLMIQKARLIEYDIHAIKNNIEQLRTIKDINQIKSKIRRVIVELEEVRSIKPSSFLEKIELNMKKFVDNVSNYFGKLTQWLKAR